MSPPPFRSPAAGSPWAEHAHRALHRHGHRVGTARERVILALSTRGRSTAQELADDLASGADRIAVSSVYRALSALVDAGALRLVTLGGVAHYEPAISGRDGGRYLVCRGCGRTAGFTCPDAEDAIAAVAASLGYDVIGEDIVVHGRCETCEPSLVLPR